MNKKMYYGTLIVVCSILMLLLGVSNNVWADEAYTMVLLRDRNAIEIIQYMIINDVHPPSYHLITYLLSLIFGINIFTIKLASIIPIILTMLLGATLVDKYWGQESRILPTLFILSLICAPNMLHMGLELRMYSWALFFVTTCGVLGYGIYIYGITKKKFIGFVVIALCAAYTHYFALLSVAVIYLYLFIGLLFKNRSNIKLCALISVVTIIGYCPWLLIFMQQTGRVSTSFWIEKVSGEELFIHYVMKLFYSTYDYIGKISLYSFAIMAIIVVVVIVIKYFKSFVNEDKQQLIIASLFVSIYFFTTIIGLGLSALITPILVARYVYPCLGLLWLGIFLGVQLIVVNKNKYWIGMILYLLVTGISAYNSEYQAAYDDGAAITQETIEANSISTDILGSDIEHLSKKMLVLEYYFPENQVVTDVELELNNIDADTALFYFSSEEVLPFEDIELLQEGILVEYLGEHNIDYYEFYLYKLYKE